MPRSKWAVSRLRRHLHNADVGLIALIAVALHLPMAAYLHKRPADWLNGAWAVSAVLVGLVITLIIFLLQAASQQSLRTEATFRAILRRTFVLWPVMLAIAFIAWTAIVERYATDAPKAGALIETYTLGIFVLQVLFFGGAIFQAIRVVSPQGVSRTITGQFRDGVFSAVERDLHDRKAADVLLQACQDHQVSFGSFMAKGWAITPRRDGWVRDVDLDLPRRLSWYKVAADVQVTAEPGERANDDAPIARSTIKVRPWLQREVTRGVLISRRPPPEAPLDVFWDAVDLARRAFLDGSSVSHDLAVDLIGDCTAVFHDAYVAFGIEY